MPRLQISSIDLGEDEIDWLRAVCNLSGTSMRAQVAQIVQGHLVRFKPHYKRKVAYVARKYGLTFEEAFKLLQEATPPFGDIVETAPIREEEEISNFGCEVMKPEKKEGSSSEPRRNQDENE